VSASGAESALEPRVEVLTVYAARRNGKMLGAELPRCLVGKPRMRAHSIVIALPRGEYGAGLGKRGEHCLVEALIAQSTNKALNEGILLRLARLDVVPADATLLLSLQDGLARKFGAIVGNAAHRLPVARD